MQSQAPSAHRRPGGDETPIMSATSGPMDPQEFYFDADGTPTPGVERRGPILDRQPHIPGQEERRGAALRNDLRAASGPAGANAAAHTLNNARSTPVLASRPVGSVKNMASKFNQYGGEDPGMGREAQQGGGRTAQEKYRRPLGAGKITSGRKSPTKEGATKLQKRRPGQSKSPPKSASTSFDTGSSFSSTGAPPSLKTQPHASFSPKQQIGPYGNSQPLFGEITSDGQWNGNFNLGDYGPLPALNNMSRRGSDGGLALNHGRSQSHADILQPMSPTKAQKLSHKRSRSDMDSIRPQLTPGMPRLGEQPVPFMYPTPPHSSATNTPHKEPPRAGKSTSPTSITSKIPVSSRRKSGDSTPSGGTQSRSASALSNPSGRNRLSKSPPRKHLTNNKEKENAKPTSIPTRGRYHPPPISTSQANQTLSAKIVPPMPKTSPPLRSSRPRQPVSSATTSASRARAADRAQPQAKQDGRRPSEQWLGKPYDPKQERSRRKIPELGKIDFAERRARIQKAISQNLEETKSSDSLRSRSRSRQPSKSRTREEQVPSVQGAAVEQNELQPVQQQAQQQTPEMDNSSEAIPGGWPLTPSLPQRSRGLSLDTSQAAFQDPTAEPEPTTATTVIEDESPVLGRPANRDSQYQPQAQDPALEPQTLLSSATYKPLMKSAAQPPPITPVQEAPMEEDAQSPTVLDNVMRMRQHSPSQESKDGTEFADDSPSAEDSPSDIEDRWGLGNGFGGDQGSIKIMLDDIGIAHPTEQSLLEQEEKQMDHERLGDDEDSNEMVRSQQLNQQAYGANGYFDSSARGQDGFQDDYEGDSTRDSSNLERKSTLRPSDFQSETGFPAGEETPTSPEAVARMLKQYQSNGTLTQEMLDEMQKRMVDLQRMSANEGSNGYMVQNLLDSVLGSQNAQCEDEQQPEMLQSTSYGMPAVTPDTPPGWEPSDTMGTAVVYSSETYDHGRENDETEEDFQEKIRKADEEWERRQRGEDTTFGAGPQDDDRPAPPPKDEGYTPGSAIDRDSARFSPDLTKGLRISTSGQLDLPEIHSAADSVDADSTEQPHIDTPDSAPPAPSHAPPPPPLAAASTSNLSEMPEPPPMPAAQFEKQSGEMSPRARKNLWGPANSPRPSGDSQRPRERPPLPASVSMSSFPTYTRDNSIDAAGARERQADGSSPSPERKRLLKRRHIIKELLDTENTYHQDLKIIEDIYKATASPDLISVEDKKILFGNCDDIERFSIHFYDELRKSVANVYVPAKQMRWANKRGSQSTTQSESTGQTSMMSADNLDDDKDRITTVGQAFQANLARMEQAYSVYLKNHDAANQRLSTLRNTPTVKCWLDECQKNASDITSAWDLDSLLVKPTQRVGKYPLLLQQLLETTPQDHPDREAISSAAKDSISILTRINDAKKRADLVDQIVNRKRKDSDVRSGIAKAFGRRTEKLKERVGIAEAFQDPTFDELGHKFGGHYIRLQICMRDVQDYMNNIDKSIDQINNYVGAFDSFNDVSVSNMTEISSKWRRYGQAVRELTAVAFTEHKADVKRRVIDPMIACIKLHDGASNAMGKRKKRIMDYAKCKSIEKRGEKPDKKTVEASEMYEALNDQLKIDLPKMYSLTATLVQGCLRCFLSIQQEWYHTWERKLRPVLEAADISTNIHQIEPAFHQDFDMEKSKLLELGICNGAVLADSANFLSPTTTLHGDSEPSSVKRPSTEKRALSVGSDSFPAPGSSHGRRGSGPGYGTALDAPPMPTSASSSTGRLRSNSSLSAHVTPTAPNAPGLSASRPWSNSNSATTPTSFATTPRSSRPATATAGTSTARPDLSRASTDAPRSPQRPSTNAAASASSTSAAASYDDPTRFSSIFNSALPPDITSLDLPGTTAPNLNPPSHNTHTPTAPTAPNPVPAPEAPPVLFVCASLFEFSIDNTRREGGFPYLTYVQGEVFDVVAQKGELWLARNQDDGGGVLGWIWEQHFVVLSGVGE